MMITLPDRSGRVASVQDGLGMKTDWAKMFPIFCHRELAHNPIKSI